MGDMKVTSDLLDVQDGKINLALVTGDIADIVSDDINGEIEHFVDSFYDALGMDPDQYCTLHGLEFWDEVTWDFRATFDKVWEDVSDLLAYEFPEIFGDGGPVKLSTYDKLSSGPGTAYWGKETEIAMFGVDIDGGRLLEVFQDLTGGDTINDGEDIPGFVRTCTDRYWAKVEVLRTIVGPEFWHTVQDMVWEKSLEPVSFGALGDALWDAA